MVEEKQRKGAAKRIATQRIVWLSISRRRMNVWEKRGVLLKLCLDS
jgi:hypothetical protein